MCIKKTPTEKQCICDEEGFELQPDRESCKWGKDYFDHESGLSNLSVG